MKVTPATLNDLREWAEDETLHQATREAAQRMLWQIDGEHVDQAAKDLGLEQTSPASGQTWLGGQTRNFGPAEEAQKPLDYRATSKAKQAEEVVWLGADGEVYAKAAPGLVPVKWDLVTGTWYDVAVSA